MQSQFAAAAALSFRSLNIAKRLEWAENTFPGKLALTSSFGIQSIVMLELLHREGLLSSIPVVMVDIAGDAWHAQRAYRDALKRHYGFDLHIFHAKDEGDKTRALEDGLKSLGITATLDGIRRSQTKTRAAKDFIEAKDNGRVAIHPLLDWADGRVDYFIEGLEPEARHPHWQPGAKSKGGLVLLKGAEKTECGLHI